MAATRFEMKLAMLTESEVEQIVERVVRRVLEEQPPREVVTKALRKVRHQMRTGAKGGRP